MGMRILWKRNNKGSKGEGPQGPPRPVTHAQYTPPTPTRLNSTVVSRRRCVLGGTIEAVAGISAVGTRHNAVLEKNYKCVAEPDLRPPGAANPSGKSI